MEFRRDGLGNRLAREARYHMALREWLLNGMKGPRPKLEPMPKRIRTPSSWRTLAPLSRKAIQGKG